MGRMQCTPSLVVPPAASNTNTLQQHCQHPPPPRTARPLARGPRVLVGWPLPLGVGLDGRSLLERRGRVSVKFIIISMNTLLHIFLLTAHQRPPPRRGEVRFNRRPKPSNQTKSWSGPQPRIRTLTAHCALGFGYVCVVFFYSNKTTSTAATRTACSPPQAPNHRRCRRIVARL